MNMRSLWFLSTLFVALSLVPAGAHLLELPNKIGLEPGDYLLAQQIYRGWEWVGAVEVAAVLAVLALAVAARGSRAGWLALVALLSLAAVQAIFWLWTFPANQATANWTVETGSFATLRLQWEYSHAGRAVLHLVALTALLLAILAICRRSRTI